MANKNKPYVSKAITTSIKASSRASIKIGDNYYTIEWTEERSVSPDANVEEERKLLWDTCNEEADNQIAEILKTFKNSKK